MSTTLQRAERMAEQKRLPPTVHRQIIIAERNKQILALKERLRMAKKLLRESRKTCPPKLAEHIDLFFA